MSAGLSICTVVIYERKLISMSDIGQKTRYQACLGGSYFLLRLEWSGRRMADALLAGDRSERVNGRAGSGGGGSANGLREGGEHAGWRRVRERREGWRRAE